MRKKKSNGSRKIQVPIMLTRTEIHWLDKMKTRLKQKSRSAVIRYMVREKIEKGFA